jgi:acetyltransferase-like isoleucine patch superfamily enzyme
MPDSNFTTGKDCRFHENCTVGFRYKPEAEPAKLGNFANIRSGTVIYGDVRIGDHFQTGHNVLVREHTAMGDHVVIGTNTVVDGNLTIGNYVKIESNCYLCTHVTIGDRVFFGPNVTLTNDRYPLKMRDLYAPEGPIIEDGVSLCAGVIVCPGVRIGKGSFIAAGAVVTADMPPQSFARGIPARFEPLPPKLREVNMALSWRKYLNE